jgi:hypothetical protein
LETNLVVAVMHLGRIVELAYTEALLSAVRVPDPTV